MKKPIISICCGYSDDQGIHECPTHEILKDEYTLSEDSREIVDLIKVGILDVILSHGFCPNCEEIQHEFNEKFLAELKNFNINLNFKK